jgi:hypothetical protein
MTLKYFIHFIFFTVMTSACVAADAYELSYELRVSKTMTADPQTSFSVVSEGSVSATRLQFANRREDADFSIFGDSRLIFSGSKRRAMVVEQVGQPAQVFRLAIPRHPKPTDWSNWQLPSYMDGRRAVWSFMDDTKSGDYSTNIPPHCYELRFKISEWKSPQTKSPAKK